MSCKFVDTFSNCSSSSSDMDDTVQPRRACGTGHSASPQSPATHCSGSPSVLSARTVSQRRAAASHHHARLLVAMVVVLTVGGGVFALSRANDNNSAAAAAWHSAAAPIQVAAAVDVSSPNALLPRGGGGGAFLSAKRAFQRMLSRQTAIRRVGDTAQLSATGGDDTAEDKLDSGVSFVQRTQPPGHFQCLSRDCTKYVTYDSGEKTVSNGPRDYGAMEYAVFAVWGPARLKFLDLGIEASTPCRCDYLEIRGDRHCGSTNPPPVQLPRGQHNITWKTDKEKTGRGYKLAIEAIASSAPLPPPPSSAPKPRPHVATAAPAPVVTAIPQAATTAPTAAPTAKKSEGTDNTQIAIVCGGAALALVGIAAIAVWWRKQRNRDDDDPHGPRHGGGRQQPQQWRGRQQPQQWGGGGAWGPPQAEVPLRWSNPPPRHY